MLGLQVCAPMPNLRNVNLNLYFSWKPGDAEGAWGRKESLIEGAESGFWNQGSLSDLSGGSSQGCS